MWGKPIVELKGDTVVSFNMVRHDINPDNLKHLAMDAFVKCYGSVLLRAFTMEVDTALEETCHLLYCNELDIRRCANILTNRIIESLVKNRLTRFYEEIYEGLRRVTQTVCQRREELIAKSIQKVTKKTLIQTLLQKVSSKSMKQNYIPEVCIKLHGVLKSALDFIHNQECESAQLNRDHPNASPSEHHVNPDCKLLIKIRNTLETVMNIISNVPSKLRTNSKHQSHEICEDLHYVMKNSVPPALANDLTQKLFQYIQNVIANKFMLPSFPVYERTTLSNIITASIHPAVTTVDFGTCEVFSFTTFKDTSSFNNIVVLKLCALGVMVPDHPTSLPSRTDFNKMIALGLKAMKNLQIFHYYYCDNIVLASLANNCKHLRCINVKGSRDLNYDSVKSFAELRYLEEVNIRGTYIRGEGLTHIINGMDQNEVTVCGNKSTKSSLLLKSLAFNLTPSLQIPLLVSKLRNIRELEIVVQSAPFTDPNLSYIKDLQFLKSLSLEHCNFLYLHEIFEVKGRELLQLELRRDVNVDIRMISENCPALTHLTLEYCDMISDPCDLDNISFPALEYLCFYDHSHASFPLIVMCGCPKLRVAKIICDYNNLDIDTVLSRNPLEHLEEMSLDISRKVPIEHLRQLAEQCTKLKELRYNIICWVNGCIFRSCSYVTPVDNNFISMLEQLSRELKDKYEGLDVELKVSEPK